MAALLGEASAAPAGLGGLGSLLGGAAEAEAEAPAAGQYETPSFLAAPMAAAPV